MFKIGSTDCFVVSRLPAVLRTSLKYKPVWVLWCLYPSKELDSLYSYINKETLYQRSVTFQTHHSTQQVTVLNAVVFVKQLQGGK